MDIPFHAFVSTLLLQGNPKTGDIIVFIQVAVRRIYQMLLQDK